jgi:RHS repeat-associated protein
VGSGGSLNNLQNLAYQWDLNGNLGQRADQIQSLTEAFNYDNLNRIQTSTLNGTQNLSVAIDNTGNITSRTEGGVTYPYTYDTTHKHAVDTVGSVGTYTYDHNGNMATRNGYSLTWASYNLPTNINGSSGVYSTFYYGPDRQRKEQVSKYVSDGQNGTETTIYVLGLYEYEMTPAQTHNKYFIQVPGGTQIVYDIQSVSGTQTTYITADHLGSGNLFINSAGTAEINESYSAYGSRRSANWAGPLSATSSDYTTIASTTRRGYTDAFHEMLDNVGLIHVNGRVYDPVIGRFLSPDQMRDTPNLSQGWNPYSYVGNNPLAFTDPTGTEQADGAIKPIDGDPPPTPGGSGGGTGNPCCDNPSPATCPVTEEIVVTAQNETSPSVAPAPDTIPGSPPIDTQPPALGPSPAPPFGFYQLPPQGLSPGDIGGGPNGGSGGQSKNPPKGGGGTTQFPNPDPFWKQIPPENGMVSSFSFTGIDLLLVPLLEAGMDRAHCTSPGCQALAAVGLLALTKGASARSVAGTTARTVANPVPKVLARAIPGSRPLTTLGKAGDKDVFVVAAEDIANLNARQLAERLSVPYSDQFTVIRFPTPPSGVASPIFRTNPQFLQGGLTRGGAREFVVPNGPIPPGASVEVIGP